MQYNFETPINRLGTYSTQWDFVQDRFGQAGLLPFTISDMDFAIAPEITQVLQRHVEHAVYGYSRWNHDDYKQAIVQWFARQFNTTIHPNSIAYSPSIIYSCAKFIDYYTQPGDGVLLHTPCYDAFIPLIEGRNRKCITSALHYDGQRYHFNKEDFIAKITQVSAVLLCSPHNPTGLAFSELELGTIVEIAKAHDVAIISDEAHMDMMLYQQRHTPIAKVWADYPKVVLATSTAKGFNLASLGGSYVIANDEAMRAHFMSDLKRDGLSSPPILHVLSTIHAYRSAAPWLGQLQHYIQANRSYIDTFLKQQLPSIRLAHSDATYFAWLDVGGLGLPSTTIEQQLIAGGLAIMRGEVYLQEDPLFLRMNIACPLSKIQQAMQIMAKIFKT